MALNDLFKPVAGRPMCEVGEFPDDCTARAAVIYEDRNLCFEHAVEAAMDTARQEATR